MKIGIVGTIWLSVPPKRYGGTEEILYNLTNGLVDKGHDVTYFGALDSKVRAKIVGTVNHPLIESGLGWENVEYPILHLTQAFDRASEFDILHVHLNKIQDYIALPLALSCKTPVVFTFHFKMPSATEFPGKHELLMKYRHLPYISISNSQRADIPLNFIATVYNGIQVNNYPYSNTPEDYFAWIGKVVPIKGPKEAIEVAKKAGVTLKFMGAIESHIPDKKKYYEEEIKPLIDNKQIIEIGEVGIKEKTHILGKARGFINALQWEEPFGLVMAEAEALGTPVIALRRGAAPEVVSDGKTGFIVDTLDEMVEKVKDIDMIKRQDCRDYVENHFTVNKMVEGYEKAYQTVITNWQSFIATQLSTMKETIAEQTA